MSKTMKKFTALFLTLIMVLSIAVMAASCGEKDKKTSSKTKATTQAVDTSEESSSAEDTQAQGNDDDGYIDEQSAIAKVREQAGTGAGIDSYYKGETPDGKKAWVVTVIPVTTDDGPETVIYYVNADFCYTETSSDDNSGSNSSSSNSSKSSSSDSSGSYISRDTAIATVKQQAGSGATIKGAQKGTAPDGKKAWVVTVEPITNGEGPDTVTYYVNEGFCYIG